MSLSSPPPQRLPVLIVDDHVDSAMALSYLVEACGCAVATAHAAESGLRMVQAFQPALLIFDLEMPGQDGVELLIAVRSLETPSAHAYAVCLTGRSDPESRHRAMAAGFDRFMNKPMQIDTLEEIVAEAQQRWLERSSTHFMSTRPPVGRLPGRR